MTVTIIGLGLIGGSIALDLKARRFAERIIGVDKNPRHRDTALERGLVDEIMKLHSGIQEADLIILAVPVDGIKELLPLILDYVTHQTVTDMGSSKVEIIDSIKDHPKRGNFVPSHPMAGTEFSGPEAAINGLFAKKVGIICDMADSNPKALETVTNFYMALNMRLVFMTAREHDSHAAYVSHISHLTSFALALTVLDKEKNEKNIFNLASGGFDSTVRLAASSAAMWVPVFSQNKNNVIEVIETYIQKMTDFKDSIASGDDQKVEELIQEANIIQKTLTQEA
ncbi:MAG: prephenate dehydrogenase [Bacteroidetes bacterium]|jgi:prephenate dehydrogenase|nr:prephenate dehydrogenase [Bacteroidota bacterium]MBT3750242.1 prephenate dehydrogenase [Bacteroidota bacterium]MBT4398509.1 prephenate dehydrogenase [Bacteroidota bacterium]MBT4411655.1 prephenate dehydrogenase [Bacteroidota bacterium]MBT5427283.1 prephenate dehydrogenase [Bacteroidota bacterium]